MKIFNSKYEYHVAFTFVSNESNTVSTGMAQIIRKDKIKTYKDIFELSKDVADLDILRDRIEEGTLPVILNYNLLGKVKK